ncbi:MAG: amidohydrolase [Candidatus Fermentithermobacillus carboniphilus]|uniref:Amidohydrolase n=1 Tax=Candidatus Fermentithermobacillus carboniphilus TaxID=3085328 RepID=A0AAT9LAU0_9FIRM|nr:MAG: amidohydrolase [Candidatus Fermentithermobacillus carboniphilus]
MLAIKNGKIFTVTGPVIEKGTILVENGKIVEVGENVSVPAGAEVVDASGKLIFPGFIDAHCHLGMWETAIGFEGDDGNEMTDPVTPHLRAIDGFNPLDDTVREAREGGVTACATGPGSANVIGGTFMAIKTVGDRVDDMVIKDPVAMKIAFGENPKRVYNSKNKMPMTRMGTAALLREALSKAKRYKEQIERAGDDLSKFPAFDAKLEALLPVLRGEIPLKAHAHRADDIFTALRIAKEFGVKITLDHCTEGHLIAGHIAKEGVPAIVGPSFGHKTKFELKNKTFETPGILARAGIKVAITTDSPVVPLETLPLMAGFAVKSGMDPEAALKAITINPAEIIGIQDRVGSLEPGKDADIAIFEGHPFEIASKAWMVLIDGKVVFKR